MRLFKNTIICLVLFSLNLSCKQEASNTFSNLISYQNKLNGSDYLFDESLDYYKIRYNSDGYEIEGFIVKPKQKELKKLPAIIFCRGGNQSYGMLQPFHLKMMADLSKRGFIVLASQLRGNISSEGFDEFGGEDNNDIINLIDIAKDINFIEKENICVLGYSRGGLNTYQISKKLDNIKAIAVVGAPTDKFSSIKFRPNMYNNVYKPLFGDTLTNRDNYIERSAIYWYHKINEPTLILHGVKDKRVSILEAKKLVDSFKKSSKINFKNYFFTDGDHSLTNYKIKRDSLIVNWFKTHIK
jgi:dipeptidyl aminopeptidase/acylaminoacyl peptidase